MTHRQAAKIGLRDYAKQAGIPIPKGFNLSDTYGSAARELCKRVQRKNRIKQTGDLTPKTILVIGKYLPGQPAPDGSRGADERLGGMMGKYLSDDVLTRVQLLAPLAKELELTMAQFALAWVLQNDNVASAIVGATRPDQITSNIEAVGVEIPAEIMQQVSEILSPVAIFDASETKSPEARLV